MIVNKLSLPSPLVNIKAGSKYTITPSGGRAPYKYKITSGTGTLTGNVVQTSTTQGKTRVQVRDALDQELYLDVIAIATTISPVVPDVPPPTSPTSPIATIASAIPGFCGTAHNTPSLDIPTTNLCIRGQATRVQGDGPWTWSCVGPNGGTTDFCSAPKVVPAPPVVPPVVPPTPVPDPTPAPTPIPIPTPTPVNGSCGSSHGQTFSSIPTANFCSTGSLASLAGTGPWTWSCTGSNGGTTASCQANVQVVPPVPVPPPTPNICGADIGGWTTPVPTPVVGTTQVARKSIAESGSRIYYISAATGDDTTGEIYFWNGSAIIDSTGSLTGAGNVPYGTDPMNPTGPIKAFKRYSYVGPRSSASLDIGAHGNGSIIGDTRPGFRAGYPDWWLFKRGETYDLTNDFLSFQQEVNPSLTSVNSSLSLPGGRSTTEREIMGAYGDPCNARPRFIHPQQGFVTRFADTPVFKNVAYLSLHFDGHDRSSGTSFSALNFIYETGLSRDILFEDVWFDGTSGAVSQSDMQLTLRRVLITDSFVTDGTHDQGFFYYGSTRQSILRIEDSILLRNGFNRIDPKVTWPPSSTNGQYWDIYNRNMYLSGETNSLQSGVFDSVSMLGGSGDQFRPGMKIERNFFYNGYVTMGAFGGYPDSAGASGSMLDNVLQRFISTTTDVRAHPGWGMSLTSGVNAIDVARNIVTNAQTAADFPAFEMSALGWYCYAHTFHYPTRQNTIHNNIFDAGNGSAVVGVTDGVDREETSGCAGWTYPGVTNNQVVDNTFVHTTLQPSIYNTIGGAVGKTNDTLFARNTIYANRNAAAQALGWTGQNNTLKTYMQSQGVTVTSADGFPEYFAKATAMRKGFWDPKWTSKALVNYFKTGFGMAPLP